MLTLTYRDGSKTNIIDICQISYWRDHGEVLLSGSIYPEKDSSSSKSHYVSTLSLASRGGKKHI